MKLCKTCGIMKPYSEMLQKKDCKDGYRPLCKLCRNDGQKKYRQDNGNSSTKSYEKTPKGYIMRTYRNMLSRVSGVQEQKNHLYLGLPILDKEDFYVWALASDIFEDLFGTYKHSGWDLRFAPSIDRKDPTKGYVLDNMRWLPQCVNSALTRRHD